MPLELRQVTSASEVPEIVQGWLENEFILTPTLVAVNWVTDEDSYKDRIKDLSARHWFTHSTSPGSVWLKVVNTDLGNKVVAASRWTRIYWLPPGPNRRFFEAIRKNFDAMHNDPTRQKPHIRLNTNYTVAEQRRRGANTLMMDWGTRKADELGLETWLEATPLGSMLYDKHGFGFHHTVDLYPPAELREDNDEWRYWEEAAKNLRLAVMRRPVNGVWNEGRVDVASFPAHDLVRNVWLE